VPGQPIRFRGKPAEETYHYEVGVGFNRRLFQLLVDHPDLMSDWGQGSQVDPSNRWDEVFLVAEAVALNVSEDDINFHRGLSFLLYGSTRIITAGFRSPSKGIRVLQIPGR